ncbi:unnamed protein product [Calypogeia fissa]
MGSRAVRTLASLGLRCLRRQLHPDQGKQQLPPVLSEHFAVLSSATSCSSSVEDRIDEGQQELGYVNTKLLLDPAAFSVDNGQKVSMKESAGRGSWNLQNSQDRSTSAWIIGAVNDWKFSQGFQSWNRETMAARHGEDAVFSKDQDFLSRYLQWRSYDRSVNLVESQNSPEAAVSAVDIDGLRSVTGQHCRSSPSLLWSSSSLDFLQDPSKITPLEASSVKRKRKKKMNKHKQRKLRRRDRHRN